MWCCYLSSRNIQKSHIYICIYSTNIYKLLCLNETKYSNNAWITSFLPFWGQTVAKPRWQVTVRGSLEGRVCGTNGRFTALCWQKECSNRLLWLPNSEFVFSLQLWHNSFLGNKSQDFHRKGQQGALASHCIRRAVGSFGELPHRPVFPEVCGRCSHSRRGLLEVSGTYLVAIYQTPTQRATTSVTTAHPNVCIVFFFLAFQYLNFL